MKTGRIEAFSDGVIAIIITIMVLELPRPEGHDWDFLVKLWPTLLSYILSFVYVGIYWNNHHHMFHASNHINGKALWANLHLLFWLSLFPYVTSWSGEAHFAPVPMSCYSIVALMCGVAYIMLARILAAIPGNEVLGQNASGTTKGIISTVMYILGAVLPLVLGQMGAYLTGILLLGSAMMWLVPDPSIERALSED